MADRKKAELRLEDLPRVSADELLAEQAEEVQGGSSFVVRRQDSREGTAADNPPPGLLAKIQIAT